MRTTVLLLGPVALAIAGGCGFAPKATAPPGAVPATATTKQAPPGPKPAIRRSVAEPLRDVDPDVFYR